MNTQQLKNFCPLDDTSMLLMKQAMEELGLSARAFDKVRRLARTIADLEGTEKITPTHVTEAIGYRLLDRKY
jgi:magnesium chelatase family protein